MTEATIPVDLFNPGQVFACLGFLEAADVLLGEAAGGFDWEGADERFRLRAAGDADPFAAVIAFIRGAKVEAIAPTGSTLKAKEPGIETIHDPDDPDDRIFPCAPPDTPSALPCRLVGADGRAIPIGHWVDRASVGLDNVKFWAGMAGYSGAALVRDLSEPVKAWSPNQAAAAAADPFGVRDPGLVSATQSSNLRFDYRGGTIPFDAGFSTNAHSDYAMLGFPLVDILAAIGLEHARPERPDRRDKLVYRYGVWGEMLPPLLARPALGAVNPGLPAARFRTFRMDLGWPGQENQARAIKFAQEDNAS